MWAEFDAATAGVVDDVFGVNYVSGTTSGDPYDDNGHGTFVAGVVGAVGNNKVGITGVAQVASIIGERPRSASCPALSTAAPCDAGCRAPLATKSAQPPPA